MFRLHLLVWPGCSNGQEAGSQGSPPLSPRSAMYSPQAHEPHFLFSALRGSDVPGLSWEHVVITPSRGLRGAGFPAPSAQGHTPELSSPTADTENSQSACGVWLENKAFFQATATEQPADGWGSLGSGQEFPVAACGGDIPRCGRHLRRVFPQQDGVRHLSGSP